MTNNPTIDGVSREFADRLSSLKQEAQDLVWAIEECGSSVKLTDAVTKGSTLVRKIEAAGAALQSTIARLEARIAELESGRVDPLIHIAPEALAMLKGERRATHGGLTYSESKPLGNWTVPLFTAPPAPVEVALPERKTFSPPSYRDGHAEGWNACLDATAALNGPDK